MKQALFALITVLLLAAPLRAQIQDLTVRVDGLICPFCAYGLQKRLSRIDEIDSVSIDQPRGLAVVTMNPGEVVDFYEMTEAVIDSGYTPRGINITATGRVELWNGRLTLVIEESERFFLNDEDQQLTTVTDTPQLVTVTGVAAVSPEDADGHKHPFTIAVERVDSP